VKLKEEARREVSQLKSRIVSLNKSAESSTKKNGRNATCEKCCNKSNKVLEISKEK
jgi:hypothetical protein